MNSNSHSNPTSPFGTSVALVLGEIDNVNLGVHRSDRTKRLSFAVDVCLVAHGVRTGYLIDAVCPPNPTETLRALLTALRGKSAVFREVVFWHHVPTTQSFLVHIPRLQDKITALLDGATGTCAFVKLDSRPSVSRDPPASLRAVLHGVKTVMAESPNAPVHCLSELFAEDDLIPLAAVLIDYPVAYYPASKAQTSFLEGEPLDVYAVSLKWTIETSNFTLGEHVLLKFSCPQVLASDCPELSSSVMINKLRVKFAAVLERMGASVSITHRTETLDRVAL